MPKLNTKHSEKKDVRKISDRDAFEALRRDLLTAKDETVPEGRMTTKQWAQECGLSETQALLYLSRGVAVGRVEMKKYRINGKPVTHYWMVSK